MKTQLLFPLLIVFLFSCGSVVSAQTFVASHNKAMADSLIQTMDQSGKLLSVKSDSVFIDGTSSSWIYLYRGSLYYYFHTTRTAVVFDSASSLQLVGATTISKTWFDSDSALVLAESQGGEDFRLHNPHYRITASLREPVVPQTMPRWYISYSSIDNPMGNLFINLDATDNLVSDVRIIAGAYPAKFVMHQNYPNPFNPSTVISFSLPRASHVRLTISNLLGRLIQTSADRDFTEGDHHVMLTLVGFPSGVYFYRIEAGSFHDVKRFVLLK